MRIQTTEVRKLVVEAYGKGKSPKELSEIFVISRCTVHRWVTEAERGQISPSIRGHRRRLISPAEEIILDELIIVKPDMTLEELRSSLNKKCSLPTIMRALVRMGYRLKKNSKGIRTR